MHAASTVIALVTACTVLLVLAWRQVGRGRRRYVALAAVAFALQAAIAVALAAGPA